MTEESIFLADDEANMTDLAWFYPVWEGFKTFFPRNGLEPGTEKYDYVTKPFDPRELAHQVEAIFRRSGLSPLQNGISE